MCSEKERKNKTKPKPNNYSKVNWWQQHRSTSKSEPRQTPVLHSFSSLGACIFLQVLFVFPPLLFFAAGLLEWFLPSFLNFFLVPTQYHLHPCWKSLPPCISEYIVYSAHQQITLFEKDWATNSLGRQSLRWHILCLDVLRYVLPFYNI